MSRTEYKLLTISAESSRSFHKRKCATVPSRQYVDSPFALLKAPIVCWVQVTTLGSCPSILVPTRIPFLNAFTVVPETVKTKCVQVANGSSEQ